ncbi:MAG: YggT family protein [Candidatus Cloacimonetes bacterium]|nr:YggT family protein [Candidatus Cloacimonadota bacterium]
MAEMSFIQYLLIQAISVYELLIVVRAILSWFSPSPYNQLYRLLIRLTEPFLSALRRYLPRSQVDFSPIVAILLLSLLGRVVQGF